MRRLLHFTFFRLKSVRVFRRDIQKCNYTHQQTTYTKTPGVQLKPSTLKQHEMKYGCLFNRLC